MSIRFLAAKTRVAPLGNMTIAQLEPLSALLLSNLVIAIQDALISELPLDNPVCYCDSKVALYWIKGCNQEWKQFIKKCVTSIHAAVPAQNWEHCPGTKNPADLPSTGVTASYLLKNILWLNGPEWLHNFQDLPDMSDAQSQVPDDCLAEKRPKKNAHTLGITRGETSCIGQLINCKKPQLSQLTAVCDSICAVTFFIKNFGGQVSLKQWTRTLV